MWIVSDPRAEHVRAISWLNEAGPAGFYLMKIEGIRITGSPPAPLLTLIVGPSVEGREVGEVKKDRAERYQVRKLFGTALLGHARSRTKLHGAISPTEYSWVGTSAGVSGLGLNCAVTWHGTSVELCIDRGREQSARTRRSSIRLPLAARRSRASLAGRCSRSGSRESALFGSPSASMTEPPQRRVWL